METVGSPFRDRHTAPEEENLHSREFLLPDHARTCGQISRRSVVGRKKTGSDLDLEFAVCEVGLPRGGPLSGFVRLSTMFTIPHDRTTRDAFVEDGFQLNAHRECIERKE